MKSRCFGLTRWPFIFSNSYCLRLCYWACLKTMPTNVNQFIGSPAGDSAACVQAKHVRFMSQEDFSWDMWLKKDQSHPDWVKETQGGGKLANSWINWNISAIYQKHLCNCACSLRSREQFFMEVNASVSGLGAVLPQPLPADNKLHSSEGFFCPLFQ